MPTKKIDSAEAIGIIIGAFIKLVIFAAVEAWTFMLTWGAWHSVLGWPSFTVGFWDSMILFYTGVLLIFSAARWAKSGTKSV